MPAVESAFSIARPRGQSLPIQEPGVAPQNEYHGPDSMLLPQESRPS
jgi:hypothetical protein